MSNLSPTVSTLLPQDKVSAGFTTRLGGVSPSPFTSLNLGITTGDSEENVCKNYQLFCEYLGCAYDDIAMMRQVHGKTVQVVEAGGVYPAGDGIVTSTKGVVLCVRVADCVPLLLYDTCTGVIASIHCGWRSIVSGIVQEALRVMGEYCSTNPGDVLAVLGPSAGPCCYNIGEEIACQFHQSSLDKKDGRLYADLSAEVRERLLEAGLVGTNIELISHCTICNDSLYFSHRRDGTRTGRMVGFIRLNSSE
jgi:polyphenol oxidase